MCTPFCLLEWFDLAPYLILLLMPFYGTLIGTDCALKISLMIYCVILYQSVVPRTFSPLAGVAMLAALAWSPFSWPGSLFPAAGVWFYGHLLAFSDPVFLLIEAFQMVLWIRACTRRLVDLIDERPILAKSLLVWSSVVVYVIIFFILRDLLSSPLHYISWIVAAFMVLQGTIHFTTLYKESGVLADASLVFLASLLALYTGYYESSFRSSSSLASTSTDSSHQDHWLWQRLLEIPRFDFASLGPEVLRLPFNLTFWMLVGVRVVAVASSGPIVGRLVRLCFSDEADFDDDEEDEEGESGVAAFVHGSPVHLKMMGVLAYTQLVVKHVTLFASPSTLPLQPVSPSPHLSLPSPVMPWERCLQSVTMSLTYLWFLWRDEMDDIY